MIAAFYGFRGGNGGISHVLLNLMNALAQSSIQVDILLNDPRIPELKYLHPRVRIVQLGRAAGLLRIPALMRYLRQTRPDALMTCREPANRAAIAARILSGVDTAIVVRVGMTISRALKRRAPIKRWLRKQTIRFCYDRNDAVVANAVGVAEDIARLTGIPGDKLHVINNPTVTDDLMNQARQSVTHPWLVPGAPPVIIGVGRLARQKDFATLIRAFAGVRTALDCRLMILGEGKEKQALMTLADALGVRQAVDFPGYVANPFAYMRRSALFVLSSAWEGSPNVLIQALALRIPVVSTDCHSGPREILAHGRYGPLVPVGNAEAMTAAIIRALKNPPPVMLMQEAADRFRVDDNVTRYMKVMGLT
jgi:glycosyltransferase involved in cell wall biosynthesis